MCLKNGAATTFVLWHKGGCGACAHQRATGATISEHSVVSSCLTVNVGRFLSSFNLKVSFLAHSENKEMDLENFCGKMGRQKEGMSHSKIRED